MHTHTLHPFTHALVLDICMIVINFSPQTGLIMKAYLLHLIIHVLISNCLSNEADIFIIYVQEVVLH